MKICPRCKRQFVDTQEACPLDEVHLEPGGDGKLPAGVGRVLGSYRLVSLLGEGGMGNIYIARHTRLNRYVAIKILRQEFQHRKDAISRFFDEARTVNRIKHPNIVESIDLVEDVVDGAYCVLELLHGPDLKTRLGGNAIAIDSAIRIAAQIADALAAVHALDVVHRDLKPQNLILITRDGHADHVKLIDFGVAQISADATSGVPFGTAAYMAPEQAAGERVDGRADVYSLGILLFEMVTGRHPFPASSDSEFVLRHADDAVPRPSKLAAGIPRQLDEVILRCLAKRADARFANASDVATALRAIDLRPPRSRGWIVATISVVLLAAGGVVAAAVVPDLLRDREAPIARAQPPEPHPTRSDARSPLANVSFESSPKGARVFRAGETVPLGTTPFQVAFPRSQHPTQFRFELAEHEPFGIEIVVEGDQRVDALLTPLPTTRDPLVVDRHNSKVPAIPPPASPKRKPRVQREGVMDPFSPN